MKIRILLALGTGLRRGDIESFKINDIDFTNNYITTTSRKTKKSMGARPVSAAIIRALEQYLSGNVTKEDRLFNDKFNYRKWKKYAEKLVYPT